MDFLSTTSRPHRRGDPKEAGNENIVVWEVTAWVHCQVGFAMRAIGGYLWIRQTRERERETRGYRNWNHRDGEVPLITEQKETPRPNKGTIP